MPPGGRGCSGLAKAIIIPMGSYGVLGILGGDGSIGRVWATSIAGVTRCCKLFPESPHSKGQFSLTALQEVPCPSEDIRDFRCMLGTHALVRSNIAHSNQEIRRPLGSTACEILPLPKPLPQELRPAGLEGGGVDNSAGGLGHLRNAPGPPQTASKWPLEGPRRPKRAST